MRRVIKESAPSSKETISYRIPAFGLNGEILVYFGGFKDHIAFFPTSSGKGAFEKEVAYYKGGRGTIQFPLDGPIPYDLVRRIVKFRVEEVTGIKKK
jgi:uncharacterized protein YdhG (YjbR/CyaY superfamily)